MRHTTGSCPRLMSEQPVYRLDSSQPVVPPSRSADPEAEIRNVDIIPAERRAQEYWFRQRATLPADAWREPPASVVGSGVSLGSVADLHPSSEVTAFLAARPGLVAFVEAARNRLSELIQQPFSLSLERTHGGDGVLLLARVEGTSAEATALMDRFDEQWLLKLPRGWDDGVVVDICSTRP